MFLSTQFALLIVTLLVTLSIISATSSSSLPTGDNEVTTTSESDSALANKNADDVFRQMVYKVPGLPIGRLPGQSNMREEVQKFREFLQTRYPQPSDWVRPNQPPTTIPAGTNAPPNECFIEVQETRKVPGRCIKLGGRIPACQSTSSDIIDIDYANC